MIRGISMRRMSISSDLFSEKGTSTSTTDTVTIRYYLVEFSDLGSSVQKNNAATPVTLPASAITSVPQTTTVTLGTAVDIARSFPLITVSGGTGNGTTGVPPTMTSLTTTRLRQN